MDSPLPPSGRSPPSRSRSSSRKSSSKTKHQSHSSRHGSSHLSPARHSSRARHEDAPNRCWGCQAKIPRDKRLCPPCYQKAIEPQAPTGQDLRAIIKEVVDDSLREREARYGHASPGPSRAPPSPGGSPPRGSSSMPPQGDSDSDIEEDLGFCHTQVPALIQAVKEVLNLEDPPVSPPKQRRLFKQLDTQRVNFPFLPELGDIFTEEWEKGDRKGTTPAKIQRFYPFKAEEVKNLESVPTVDAAVVRLAKYVTLPLEDTASFKDPLERRLDSDLKRLYLLSGQAAKPALALATISKAMENWAECIDLSLIGVSEEVARNSPAQEIRTAASFVGEASIDLIRLLARSMFTSVTARRALWLRPWRADMASKQAWCKIPFSGSSLFGEKLNEAIARTTGGTSGLLPQMRRQQRRRSFPPKKQSVDRAKEARAYRPGREYGRAWKPRQTAPQKATKSSPAPGKTF